MKLTTLHSSRYPVTLQCTYPGSEETAPFATLLKLLSEYGFSGIELNLPDLSAISVNTLQKLLDSSKLQLTYIATGAYAKVRGFSLSSPDPILRRKSIEGCKENIRYAGQFHCGIIIGLFKNQPSDKKENAEHYLTDSLIQLSDFAEKFNVQILLEATNRYESCVANALADTFQIVCQTKSPVISILPDTFHMNIEERDPFQALRVYRGHYPNVHLSDNNRFFPGMGCIPFEHYIQILDDLQYHGTLGIEGAILQNTKTDLEIAVRRLSPLLCD